MNPNNPMQAPQPSAGATGPVPNPAQPTIITPTNAPSVQPMAAAPTQPPANPATPAPEVTPPTPGVVAGGDGGVSTGQPPVSPAPTPSGGAGRKKLIIGAVAAVAGILLVGGGVFGLYLPSRPENVYKTGLDRTGKALEGVVVNATEADKIAAYKKSEITGNFTATTNDTTYSGDLKAAFDEDSVDAGLNVQIKPTSQAAKQLNAKLLAQWASDKRYPDLYVQANGLSSLGLGSLIDTSKIDNRWIGISADYLQSLESAYTKRDDQPSEVKNPQPTAAEIAEVSKAVTAVTREYVFTADPAKAVLENKQYVGKETVDGVSAHHYKVDYNVANTKAYCKAVSSAFLSTKAYKRISGDSDAEIAKSKAEASKSCDEDIKPNTKGAAGYLDLWIDAKYKLIHKVRVYSDTDRQQYAELGQRYEGSKELRFFVNTVDKNHKLNTELSTNTETNVSKLTIKGSGNEGKDTYELSLSAKPSNKDVTVTAPANTVPLEQLIQELSASQ